MRGLVIGALMLTGSLWGAGDGTGSAEQTILTIRPYFADGQWVFDDARVGLDHEPIDLPHAREGKLLWFSARPFPGYDVHLRPGPHCRLCPALLRYFPTQPEDLYVRLGD